MAERADVVVLGMGPGGEEVAGRLAEAGLDVVGVEGRLLGGECPYWGCIPSKMILRAAGLLAEARRIPGMAGTSTVVADWAPVARRIRDEATDNWDDRVAVERFESNGGRFVRGWGRLAGPGRVVVGDLELEAGRAVVVATGTQPWVPPVPGLGTVEFWTNREAIEATDPPSSLLVLGGGAIGVELAQAFARFGSVVTVMEAAPDLLPAEEPEAGQLLGEALGADGIAVHTGAQVQRVDRSPEGISVTLAGAETLTAERLLVATGRCADLGAFDVGSVGLEERARFITVDDRLRAGPRLWAVGDVTGVGAFTYMAVYQARIALEDILGRDPAPALYRAVPRVTFTDPEVGSVGPTCDLARPQFWVLTDDLQLDSIAGTVGAEGGSPWTNITAGRSERDDRFSARVMRTRPPPDPRDQVRSTVGPRSSFSGRPVLPPASRLGSSAGAPLAPFCGASAFRRAAARSRASKSSCIAAPTCSTCGSTCTT